MPSRMVASWCLFFRGLVQCSLLCCCWWLVPQCSAWLAARQARVG